MSHVKQISKLGIGLGRAGHGTAGHGRAAAGHGREGLGLCKLVNFRQLCNVNCSLTGMVLIVGGPGKNLPW